MIKSNYCIIKSCIRVHICIRTYLYTNISVYEHICIRTYLYTNISVYEHICIRTYLYTNISVYVWAYSVSSYEHIQYLPTNIFSICIRTYLYTNIFNICIRTYSQHTNRLTFGHKDCCHWCKYYNISRAIPYIYIVTRRRLHDGSLTVTWLLQDGDSLFLLYRKII